MRNPLGTLLHFDSSNVDTGIVYYIPNLNELANRLDTFISYGTGNTHQRTR